LRASPRLLLLLTANRPVLLR